MLDAPGSGEEDPRPVQDLRDSTASPSGARPVCPDCLAKQAGLEGVERRFAQCDACKDKSRLACKRKRYMRAFATADDLLGLPVEIVMVTITPPTLEERAPYGPVRYAQAPPKAHKIGKDTWTPTWKDWRGCYIWLFNNLRRTAMWDQCGFVGGIYAFEEKRREPGEWISCAKSCCKGQNPRGVLCPHNGYGREATDDDTHPHLHIVCRKLTAPFYASQRVAQAMLSEYTEGHGFGYVRIDKKRSGNLLRAVRYCTKYVTKDTRSDARSCSVWGDLHGKITANQTTDRARRRHEGPPAPEG